MLFLDEYMQEYLQNHNDNATKLALSKITENTRIIRRGINIAVEDKFKTSSATNPYYDELSSAGINDEEIPILADFFEFATQKESAFLREWKSTHKHLGNVRQVRPALKDWRTIVKQAETTQDNNE